MLEGDVVYESGSSGIITRYTMLFLNGRNIRNIHMPENIDPRALLVERRQRLAEAATAYQRRPKIDQALLQRQAEEKPAAKSTAAIRQLHSNADQKP